MKHAYIAIDQHGQNYNIGYAAPRKWLLNFFCRQHADKMYQDDKNGNPVHTGYIIAKMWLSVYKITPFK